LPVDSAVCKSVWMRQLADCAHNNELAWHPSSDGVRGPTGEISMEESEMNHAVSMERRIKLALALGILFGFALPVELSAQVVGATVSGRVVDPSGAVAPGASISIENVATGTIANGVTNAVGLYTVPNIQPGTYQLKASAPGFATKVRSGIILTVGEELVLNLTLKVGSASQSVTVTSEAPTVDLANSTLGGINNTTTVTELPLNGRSWSDLATLQPGVHFSKDQPPLNSGDRVDRGLGVQFNISGARTNQNSYLLDGVNIGDHSNNGPGSVLGGNLGVDSVAEFTVLTTNYSA
jgi:carboxypeptidase family protein